MSIDVTNLLKIYGEQKAVHNISFHIRQGEITGFLGPNGAGKSTTMKIITGYLRPDAGQVSVCGIPVATQPIEVKKRIGYLPEQNALYYDMYVREYLGFLAGIHRLHHKKQRIEAVLETVGLLPEAKKIIGQLSKGYKQRVGLAAALIHDPDVLILDEPTTGLDPNQIIEIREVIRRQGKQKTILFSSHILQEVEALCDRVLVIHKGSIVADDALEVLRSKGNDSQQVRVEFKEPVEAVWLSNLTGVAELQSIQLPGATGKKGSLFSLRCSDAEAVKKQILQLALQHNLNIISLQSESRRLEEIFKSLTT